MTRSQSAAAVLETALTHENLRVGRYVASPENLRVAACRGWVVVAVAYAPAH
jgi:hypothetical protein